MWNGKTKGKVQLRSFPIVPKHSAPIRCSVNMEGVFGDEGVVFIIV